MVAGIAKSYNLTFDYVLYEMSYANIVMYGAVLPSYDGKDNKDDRNTIKADDPRNKDKVRSFLAQID